MSVETASQIIERLVEGGLEEKYARIILSLCAQPPLKASEIGKLVSISRMDAYNSLKKLQEMGFVKATLDKPMRFTGIPVNLIGLSSVALTNPISCNFFRLL